MHNGHIMQIMTERNVGSGAASKQLGVARRALLNWWHEGKVKPEWVTPGGHPRWDMAKLRSQLNIKEPPA